MKLIRCEDAAGAVGMAALTPGEGPPVRVEGSLEAGFRETGEPVEVARLLAPVEPAAIYGVALNYRDHARETGKEPPREPVIFMKSPGAVVGPHEPIVLPRHLASERVDYEAELAVVIGRACRNLTEAEALGAVAGYTCANDVSARDWQFERGGGQFCKAKSFDSFCPLGPCLVTPDEVGDPQALDITMEVTGERLQEGNTREMIFTVARLVSFLSGSMTLPAGSVILTGTPAGVGAGREPPRYLRAGDVCRVAIPGLGTLENPVVEEATG